MNITRASHVALTVSDLDRSIGFYERVVGLVLTEREGSTAYLRGLEEACHHSLVLVASGDEPRCLRLGFRVFEDEDLHALHERLATAGHDPRWVDVAHQGPTLHVDDDAGVRLEFCATMDTVPRRLTHFSTYAGGSGQRLDHFQLQSPDVASGRDFYCALGFRISEYIARQGEPPEGVFLQRKGNPHDLVLFTGPGPRLHHTAFTTPDVHTLVRACDVAGELGLGRNVERGPGRHGPGHALFVYLRDPDGHRVELFTTHYQVMDSENEPVRWEPGDPRIAIPWGLPAQSSWHEEATVFAGVPARTPASYAPMTLERFLAS
jgi:catechol 2,3-dioxygenase